jgi:hypothetical protein
MEGADSTTQATGTADLVVVGEAGTSAWRCRWLSMHAGYFYCDVFTGKRVKFICFVKFRDYSYIKKAHAMSSYPLPPSCDDENEGLFRP